MNAACYHHNTLPQQPSKFTPCRSEQGYLQLLTVSYSHQLEENALTYNTAQVIFLYNTVYNSQCFCPPTGTTSKCWPSKVAHHIPDLSLLNLIRWVSTIKESSTELSNISNPASVSAVPQLFNKSTCTKYHHLFVAVLHRYRNYLKLWSSLSCKNPLWHFKNKDDKKNVIDAFQMVWAASHILQVYAFPPTFLIYLLGVCHVNIYSFQPPNSSHEPNIDWPENDEEEEGGKGKEEKELEERGNNLGNPRIKSSDGYIFKLHLGQHWTFCLHMLRTKQVQRHQYHCWLHRLMSHLGALCERMWLLR